MKELKRVFGNEMTLSAKGKSFTRRSGGKTINVFPVQQGYNVLINGLTEGTRQIHVKSAEQAAMVTHALIKGCRLKDDASITGFIDRFKTMAEMGEKTIDFEVWLTAHAFENGPLQVWVETSAFRCVLIFKLNQEQTDFEIDYERSSPIAQDLSPEFLFNIYVDPRVKPYADSILNKIPNPFDPW